MQATQSSRVKPRPVIGKAPRLLQLRLILVDPDALANVRFGSNSEVELADVDFRFTPQSRHPAGGLGCRLRAMNGLMRRSKRHLYSITLSARPSSEGGTARPSALAVLRLTIGSDFVGACTHLGLPYESHRLQAPDRKGSTSEVQQ